MTKREFFEAVMEAEVPTEIKDFCKAELNALDERNEKRRNTLSPKQVENENFKEKILAILADTPEVIASEVAKELEMSTQRASSLLKQLEVEGKLETFSVKVKGKSPVKGYKLSTH